MPAASLAWVDHGTALFVDTVHAVAYDGDSALPAWTRRHVAAHIAANADAVGNLVHWARTGERTPMYPSRAARDADIERGARLPVAELDAWVSDSAARLRTAFAELTDEQWRHEVVTGQGATVTADHAPYMRARELYIHTVDLDAGVGFGDLPEDFLEVLVADVAAQRDAPSVTGPLGERAAWLTGRPHRLVDAPELGAWL